MTQPLHKPETLPLQPDSVISFKDALILIGGLSSTSKMPGYSWSISAFSCQTGSKLSEKEGSVCFDCYARKGSYMYPVVKNALDRREKALSDPLFVSAFIVVLDSYYSRMRKTYLRDGVVVRENRFRWHDSGDLQGVDHLVKICQIAEALPHLDFWLPTKEPQYVNLYLKAGKKIPSNLTIRVSNPMVGVRFKARPMGLPFSTVNVSDPAMFQCKAPSQGGKCLDCRACWDKDVDTNYAAH